MRRIAAPNRKGSFQSGQTMVEFMFGASLLLMVLFAILMMGEMVFTYNSISEAAREATRFAIVHGNTGSTSVESSVQNVAIAAAPALGLKTSNVTVSFPQDLNVPSQLDAKVVITYTYNIRVPFMKAQQLSLTTTAQMPVSP